ncbi:hypothetical protein KXQ82_11990 [Mucilaginibacter sp. HMF5004]|uniref:hypothetical protein n=1 Tax=Mucilaginibacter rivuli TaxID=2857527 RepID=UPI001C5F2504|nr:hypothetical protein [Mucilaginibacter rivuli]MBW4890446.1 hypothetical protein [Mucilaginibacter rivuli]
MKKISLTMFAALVMLASSFTSQAQVSVSINIGNPPVWAPPAYAHTTRYYYIPEIDSYYDAQNQGYYYNDGPGWTFSASLPGIYASYNIARLHHIRVNYYGARPYTYFAPQRTVYVQRYHPVQYRPAYREVRYREVERERGHWDNGNHGGRGPQWHGNGGGHEEHGEHEHGHGGGHGNH